MEQVAIPKVSGRHRNMALAAERRRRCVEMVLSGWSYQGVADELGYANRGTVYNIVMQTLVRTEVENVAELRELELARLDALQAAHWDKACAGDVASAYIVLKIIDRRARVLGLSPRAHLTAEDGDEATVLW